MSNKKKTQGQADASWDDLMAMTARDFIARCHILADVQTPQSPEARTLRAAADRLAEAEGWRSALETIAAGYAPGPEDLLPIDIARAALHPKAKT